MKKILISGYYGFDNSGDDAILKAMVEDLKENDNSIEITALSRNPTFTEKIYNIRAVNRFKIRDVMRAIEDCNLFISGGGSLLQDVTSTRSLLYYLSLMEVASKLAKPIMVYANGIGPINGKVNRVLTKRILDKVDIITLRDEDSKYFLNEIKVKNKNIHVTADPVFTLKPSDDWSIGEILTEEGIPMDAPLVGVSIRNWLNESNLIANMAKAVNYIIEVYKANIVLIPMHYPEDLLISKSLLKKANNPNCYVLSNKYGVEDIMGIIKGLEMIIAMRLHSLIYATTQGTPMVGIVYDPKIQGFLKTIEMEYMCPVEGMEYDQLIENIDQVWTRKGLLREQIKDTDLRMRNEALKNVSMALSLLEG